jgi:hypothetical protein
MKNKLQNLSELIARANDVFYSNFDFINTLNGDNESELYFMMDLVRFINIAKLLKKRFLMSPSLCL